MSHGRLRFFMSVPIHWNFQNLDKHRTFQKKLSNYRNKSQFWYVYNMRTQILKPEAR